MRISARNILKGKVKVVTHGAVNSEIVVELPGGQEIVSVITKTSAESLGLESGKEVCAVIKASNVMLAVDE
jgi:molybdopterin-binding protein